jgi:hypothetical protein
MENSEPKFKRGTKRDMVGYFYAYPGRVITLQELEQHFVKAWTTKQIQQAMNGIVREAAVPIEKLTSTTWRLVEGEELGTTTAAENQIILTVIKETDEATIAIDEQANVYKLFLLG